MKLTKVRIENFRSFRDATIPINDYTCLVGPNGAGKSTVIAALDLFFRDGPAGSGPLEKEDFHRKRTDDPVRVTLTFEALTAEAQEDLQDYYRHGKLIVFAEATWDATSESAPVVQHGIRLGLARFKKYFAMADDNASAKELKAEFSSLRDVHPDIATASTKDDMAAALHAYEQANPDACVEIPSRDQFYGFTRGANRLARHVQWVHVPAVKDASEESTEAKHTWLGALLARAVRNKVDFDAEIEGIKQSARGQYDAMLEGHQVALQELSDSLSSRMAEWANPDSTLGLKWEGGGDKAVAVAAPLARLFAGDGRFEGDLARHGHGFQRSYLLALLQELAADAESGPRLILACEEPELFQHPPQARYLATAFERLSQKGNQVLVCTHSPLFVSGRAFEDVRLLRRGGAAGESTARLATFDGVSRELTAAGMPGPKAAPAARAKLHQALQPSANELFFSPVLVLVEGLSDVGYLTAHLAISGAIDEFRRLGCHVVSANGKGYLPELLAVAKLLDIPTFVVFDADGEEGNVARRAKHEKENAAILHLAAAPDRPPFPDDDLWLPHLVQWKTCIEDTVQADLGHDELVAAQNDVRNAEGLVSEPGLEKNSLYLGLVLAHLDAAGRRSANLDRLCQAILAFARGSHAPAPAAATSAGATAPAPPPGDPPSPGNPTP